MQKPAGKKKIPNSPRGSFVGVWVGFFSFLPLFLGPACPRASSEHIVRSTLRKERNCFCGAGEEKGAVWKTILFMD